jgi:competence protein ComEA
MSLPVIMGDIDREFTGTFVLDPNTAPVDSLELLPGIGKVLADRIVEYRQHHAFEREVDITEVKGIGPKVYDRLRTYLRVKRP